MLYGTGNHPLLTGEVANVDVMGGNLGALVFDQPNGLGQILGLRGWVSDVRTDRSAGVDGDDVRAGAGQPDAVRASLSAGGTGDVSDSALQWPLRRVAHADTSRVVWAGSGVNAPAVNAPAVNAPSVNA